MEIRESPTQRWPFGLVSGAERPELRPQKSAKPAQKMCSSRPSLKTAVWGASAQIRTDIRNAQRQPAQDQQGCQQANSKRNRPAQSPAPGGRKQLSRQAQRQHRWQRAETENRHTNGPNQNAPPALRCQPAPHKPVRKATARSSVPTMPANEMSAAATGLTWQT